MCGRYSQAKIQTEIALEWGEGVGGDDAADALRYLVATKPREVRVRRLSGV